MGAAGAAEQLEDPQQQHRQPQVTGELPEVEERQEVHVLQGEGRVEAAGGDELPEEPQQPAPLRDGAAGQRLRQSHQQTLAEHVHVVGSAAVQGQAGQHGGLQRVGHSAALHPGQETSAQSILRQVRP